MINMNTVNLFVSIYCCPQFGGYPIPFCPKKMIKGFLLSFQIYTCAA